MKKKNLFLGILAVTLVFAITAVGCGDDTTDDNNNPGGGSGGTLTVTGIPSQYNGKYAYLSGGGSDPTIPTILGAQSCDLSSSTFTLVQIANGSVSLPLWAVENGSFGRYSGNHAYSYLLFAVNETQTLVVSGSTPTFLVTKELLSITFSNGSATKSWSGDGGGTGGNIVNNSGEAWVFNGDTGTGWIFKSDGTYQLITKNSSGTWDVGSTGTYTVSGNTLTSSDSSSGTYSVSGNTLTFIVITSDGTSVTLTLTRTSITLNSGSSSTAGTLTVTGIPGQYNGKYAMCTFGSVSGYQSTNGSSITLVQIVNGSVNLPMWKDEAKYSGNDTFSVGSLYIYDTPTYSGPEQPLVTKALSSITFSNGSATKSW